MIKLINLLKEVVEAEEMDTPQEKPSDKSATFNLPLTDLDNFIRGIKDKVSNFEYEEVTTEDGQYLVGFQSRVKSPVFRYNKQTQTLEYYPQIDFYDKKLSKIRLNNKFIEDALKIGRDMPLDTSTT